jgi:uncharacterized hydrophobic protein (TIGR00271 family)
MDSKLFKKIKDLIQPVAIQSNEKGSEKTQKKNSAANTGQIQTIKEKTAARAGEIKEFMGHVIEPDERTMKNYMNIDFWLEKKKLYRELREKEKQDQNVFQNLSDGASPTLEYYILTVLSCIIATTGLLQGSTATIIGAMIVAPLMTPILAFSLGVIWGDLGLIRTSSFSLFKGIVISLAISSVIAFLIPMEGYSSEITSRTSPTIFDIIVAFASGLVGAYGNANKRISNTLVGIAIAVALMPPLCTVGIGIGTINKAVASGAALLFIINLVSISLAGAIVFWAMSIHPTSSSYEDVRKRALYQIIISIIILTSIAIPVGFYMKNTYLLKKAERTAGDIIHRELPGFSLIQLKGAKHPDGYLFTATITGKEKPEAKKISAISESISKSGKGIAGIKIMFLQSAEITPDK